MNKNFAPKKILVTTDFSPCSLKGLKLAFDLAKPLGAEVHALHVIEIPNLALYGREYAMVETPDIRDKLLEGARKQFERLIQQTECAPTLPFGNCHLETSVGPVAETIADFAQKNSFDLIVTTTHGRTGLPHLLLGSVAERLVRTARVPLLTARAG